MNKPKVCRTCDCWDSCKARRTNPRYCETETQYDIQVPDNMSIDQAWDWLATSIGHEALKD